MDRRGFVKYMIAAGVLCPSAWAKMAKHPLAGLPLPKWREGHLRISMIYTGRSEAAFLVFPDGTKKGPEGFLTGRLQVSGIKGGDSGDLAGFPVYIYGINPFRMIRIPADDGTVFLHLRDEPGRFLFGESDHLRQVGPGVWDQVDPDCVRESRHGQHNGQQERKYIFIPAFHMIPP